MYHKAEVGAGHLLSAPSSGAHTGLQLPAAHSYGLSPLFNCWFTTTLSLQVTLSLLQLHKILCKIYVYTSDSVINLINLLQGQLNDDRKRSRACIWLNICFSSFAVKNSVVSRSRRNNLKGSSGSRTLPNLSFLFEFTPLHATPLSKALWPPLRFLDLLSSNRVDLINTWSYEWFGSTLLWWQHNGGQVLV